MFLIFFMKQNMIMEKNKRRKKGYTHTETDHFHPQRLSADGKTVSVLCYLYINNFQWIYFRKMNFMQTVIPVLFSQRPVSVCSCHVALYLLFVLCAVQLFVCCFVCGERWFNFCINYLGLAKKNRD